LSAMNDRIASPRSGVRSLPGRKGLALSAGFLCNSTSLHRRSSKVA
jgi:hypothetical protein